MKKIYRMTLIPLIAMLAFTGCNDDKNESKKASSSVSQQTQKEISFNEHNMIVHLREFQSIAIENGGNRSVGSAGGKASANYIIEKANLAGFDTMVTEFKNKDNKNGKNIVVEIPGKSRESIVLIGTHYDSVPEGPGINDNASGVSVLLELMNQLRQQNITPNYTIRLGFWDSEEVDLDGSKDYANKLNEAELKKIKAYLNVDMIGARYPIAMIPNSDKAAMLKELEERLRQSGSIDESFIQSQLDIIRRMPLHPSNVGLDQSLSEFFKTKNLAVEKTTTMNERTDILSFAGKVPTTGFIFRSRVPGEDELIPCYHKACDTSELVDPQSLGISGGAIVHLLKKLKAL